MMTKDVGTLLEIGAQVGDVVEAMAWGYDWPFDGHQMKRYSGKHWTIYEHHPKGWCGMCAVYDGDYTSNGGYTRYDETMLFRIISRANQPKLWRDMTPEEKGALLLAAHEGKVIENRNEEVEWGIVEYPAWYGDVAYRIKPEPKVETVTAYYRLNCDGDMIVDMHDNCGHAEYRITFNTIDGKPDCASIKMEEL